jgi:methyltransferase (TIGR00027 family)
MERAMESERSDALFHDPCATDLVGPRGKEIAKKMGRSGWAVTVRIRVLDDLLLRTLREHQVHTVLSLGAGLDARPYRLDLPGDLRWIEVDVPETIDYKERVLALVAFGTSSPIPVRHWSKPENFRTSCITSRSACSWPHRP